MGETSETNGEGAGAGTGSGSGTGAGSAVSPHGKNVGMEQVRVSNGSGAGVGAGATVTPRVKNVVMGETSETNGEGSGTGAGSGVSAPGKNVATEQVRVVVDRFELAGVALEDVGVGALSASEREYLFASLGRTRARHDALVARLVAARQPVGSALVGAAERSAELVRASGVSQREARRSVRVAEALAEAPVMAAALAAGEVTPGHVEAVAYGVDRLDRVAADADPGLRAAARELSADGFRAVVDEWQRDRLGDVDGRRLAGRQHRRRRAQWRTLSDGMMRFEADLAPDAGAVIAGELGRISQGLWRNEDGRVGVARPAAAGKGHTGGAGELRSVVQRNADALVEMARRSSTGATGGGSEVGVPVRGRADIVCVVDYGWISRRLQHLPQPTGDPNTAALELPPPADALPSNVDALSDVLCDVLCDVLSGKRRCETDDGIPLTPTQLRRLACDAGVLPVVMGGNGQVLDMGRRQRTVSPAQRTALIVRDGGCIFPGCDRPPSWCDAHHIIHWLDREETELWNLCLLCSNHHHHVHDGGWTLKHLDPLSEQGIGNGRIGFTDPAGRTHEPDRRTRRTPAA